MVYVILQPRILPGISIDELKKSKKSPTENCIKIGFTTCFEKRLGQYTSDTPRFDVLYTYDEGTVDDEWGLHQYFKEYQVEELNGREWFIWNEEIIKFFETNTTIDQIREYISEFKKRKDEIKEKRERREQIDRLTPLINLLLDLEIDRHILPSAKEDEDIADKFLWRKRFERLTETLPLEEDVCLDFLRTELDESLYDDLVGRYEMMKSGRSEIESELKVFGSFGCYHKGMRYLCEVDISSEKRSLLFNYVPWYYKNYYNAFGIGRCKALMYQKGNLEQEYQRQLNNHTLPIDDIIYEAFHAGDRELKSVIKAKLAKIYKDSGYDATAKASDINNWFKTKPIQITNRKTKKRENGFELLKRLK